MSLFSLIIPQWLTRCKTPSYLITIYLFGYRPDIAVMLTGCKTPSSFFFLNLYHYSFNFAASVSTFVGRVKDTSALPVLQTGRQCHPGGHSSTSCHKPGGTNLWPGDRRKQSHFITPQTGLEWVGVGGGGRGGGGGGGHFHLRNKRSLMSERQKESVMGHIKTPSRGRQGIIINSISDAAVAVVRVTARGETGQEKTEWREKGGGREREKERERDG